MMSVFNGKRFCDYEGISAVQPDDSFLISRPCEDGQYVSMKAAYSLLCSYIMTRFNAENKFESMAYESKYKYAPVNHTHNYTDFKYVSGISSGIKLAHIESKYQNGKIETYPVLRPETEYAKELYPDNGQVRFVYSSYPLNSSLTDINSAGFDGWFLANGLCVEWAKITNQELVRTKAYNCFTTSDGKYLHIPRLDQFVKAYPGVYETPEQVVLFKTTVRQHSHSVLSAQAFATVGMRSSGSYIKNNQGCSNWNTASVHRGKDTTKADIALSSQFRISTDPISVSLDDYTGRSNAELYPTHVQIPTLVYIYCRQVDDAFTVKFLDMDGSILKTEKVEPGGDATPPSPPVYTGYTFQRWDGNYTAVVRDTTVKAVYTAKSLTITFDKQGGSGGTNSIAAQYNAKYKSKISIPSKAGFTFAGYFLEPLGHGTRIYDANGSTSAVVSFIQDTTLYAYYNSIMYTLTLSASPSSRGTVSGGGKFASGSTVTVVAKPKSGCSLKYWSDGGAATHAVTVSSDMSLTAYFKTGSAGITGGKWVLSSGSLKLTASWRLLGRYWYYSGSGNVFKIIKSGNQHIASFKSSSYTNGETISAMADNTATTITMVYGAMTFTATWSAS